MWPFSAIRIRRSRLLCLREIVARAKANGIELTENLLTVSESVEKYSRFTNIPINALQNLKTQGTKYTMEFFVGHRKCVPEGYFDRAIGETKNQEFELQKKMFHSQVCQVNVQLSSKFAQLTAELQKPRLQAWKEELDKWEHVSMEEWERRNVERQKRCVYCEGTREVSTGRYKTISAGFSWQEANGSPVMETCRYCYDGTGDALALSEYHKPPQPDPIVLSYWVMDRERREALSERGFSYPPKHFSVWMKLAPQS